MENNSWIHNFAITSTSRHKKGYTIYKIISIIFPKNIPEALSTIHVWKRFRDVKELHKQIQRKHHEKRLPGKVPELRSDSYFKRLDPDVIKVRKESILQLMYFIAEHPALYQSQPFANFFERHNSPTDSPLKSPAANGNIAKICTDINIPTDTSILLIAPQKDEPDETGSLMGSIVSSETSDTCSLALEETIPEKQVPLEVQESVKPHSLHLLERVESVDYSDYLYEAAYEFSEALKAETNGKYKEAFDLYKNGIDKMLQGVKSDKDDNRRKIVKAKVSKYLEHAEEIFQKHILNSRDDMFAPVADGLSVDSSEVQNMERPLNYLARYKVVRLVRGLMQVMDVTTKVCYIMKPIEKLKRHTLFLPQGILYMSPLVLYFQSDTTVYLLLQLAKGGNLWDYIQLYANKVLVDTRVAPASIESMFVDPQPFADEEPKDPAVTSSGTSPNDGGYDSGFVDQATEARPKQTQPSKITSINESDTFIPSFDTLSMDMDTTDLVQISQKLLNSVANTLEVLRTDQQPIEESDLLVDNLDLAKIPEFQSILKRDVKNSQNYSEILKINNDLSDRLTDQSSTVSIPADSLSGIDFSFLDGSIKQWTRELIVAIQSLHSHGIICGDLCMDNLLLGSNGQLLLTYFYRRDQQNNICLELVSQRARCGWYVAPERPLTFASDWWSLGVVLFELVTKHSYISCHPCGPFFYYEVQYPEMVEMADDAKELIEGLLQINPEDRFGLADIMNHPYFGATNWTDVKAKGKTCN